MIPSEVLQPHDLTDMFLHVSPCFSNIPAYDPTLGSNGPTDITVAVAEDCPYLLRLAPCLAAAIEVLSNEDMSILDGMPEP